MSDPRFAREFDEWQVELHGHRVIYRIAGSGPPVVLIHGMVNSSRHWEQVALQLADSYTVVAPDLIGHGDSATPRGDYSLGAHAAVIRDLLAMVFFYQFPQRTERLALVSAGGLGPEVSPLLRSAALPGASALLSLVAHPKLMNRLDRAGEQMRDKGSKRGVYLQAVARALRPLERPGAREAFLQTLRAVIDAKGQRISARDRLYLLDSMPTLIVWGERDNTIPLAHGRYAHEAVPGSRFVTLPKAAHFPHLEDPDGLAATLRDFLETTEPAQLDDADWGSVIARRAPRSRRAPARAA
jgi:pimeloyl-ACP methyl ester carboxylesterase